MEEIRVNRKLLCSHLRGAGSSIVKTCRRRCILVLPNSKIQIAINCYGGEDSLTFCVRGDCTNIHWACGHMLKTHIQGHRELSKNAQRTLMHP